MICRDAPSQRAFGVAIEKKKDDGFLWGEFKRDPDTKSIEFAVVHPPAPSPAPRIIGGEDLDEDRTGTIVGVFKAA